MKEGPYTFDYKGEALAVVQPKLPDSFVTLKNKVTDPHHTKETPARGRPQTSVPSLRSK